MRVFNQRRRLVRKLGLYLTSFTIISMCSLPAIARSFISSQGEPVLRVWKVGSPHRGEVPDNRVPLSFQQRVTRSGYRLDVRTMAAGELFTLMSEALTTNDEPDILVFDNYGLLLGITTSLGHFQGLYSDPRIRPALINVSEAFQPLQTTHGWEFLLRTSRNFLAAKSLALMEPDCNREFGARGPWVGDVQSHLEQLAESAAAAYFHHDLTALDSLTGERYLSDSERLREPNSTISKMKVCGGWGNSRLAFVNTVTTFENANRLGSANLLEIFDQTATGWRLLSVGGDPRIIGLLQQQAFALKSSDEARSSLRTPMPLAPDDGVQSYRWPASARPDLEWSAAGDGPIVYLVEAQFTDPIRPGTTEILWTGRGFTVIRSPGHTQDQTITTKATFGAGQQPHRWRIWAIDENGFHTLSEWRTVNYLN